MSLESSGLVARTSRTFNGTTCRRTEQPTGLQENFQWSEEAFSNDEVTYKDNIKIIKCDQLCPSLNFFLGFKRLKLWLVKDIAGIIAAVFTWLLVVLGELVFLNGLLFNFYSFTYAVINGVASIIMAFLGVASHARCMFMDPGTVPRGNATPEKLKNISCREGEILYKCTKCVSIKPERAHHCSVCRRCIRKMDHHCPWVNNCVGQKNQKFFVLFTLYVCLISCHALVIAIHQLVYCIQNDMKGCSSFNTVLGALSQLFLLFESLLFGIFTAVMFFTQLAAICSDETGIEQLKKETALYQNNSRWQNLKDVFGNSFSLQWFSPFHSNLDSLQTMQNFWHTV